MNSNTCLYLKYTKVISKEPIVALSKQCHISHPGLGVQKETKTHLNPGLKPGWNC